MVLNMAHEAMDRLTALHDKSTKLFDTLTKRPG